MRYQAVQWAHDGDEDPVVLYSEVDAGGYERRKVDEYRNGHLDVAGAGIETGSTALSSVEMPDLAAIDAMAEFSAREISAKEVDEVWNRAPAWFDLDR